MMKKLTLISFVLFSLSTVLAETILVPEDFQTIQSAIEYSTEGDSIIVSNGVYYESIDFLGKAITVASQYIYSNNESDIENTVIDANQASYNVVRFTNDETRDSKLIGFSVTGGSANGDEDFDRGGGIFIDGLGAAPPHTSPHIESCHIYDNSAISGGGIALGGFAGDALLKKCKVYDNTAQSGGGGIFLGSIHAKSTIDSTDIFENSAETGGGILNMFRQSSFDNCEIYSNTATVSGSAITAKGGVLFNRTIFYNHNSESSIIAIENLGLDPYLFIFFNCTFVNNQTVNNVTFDVSGNAETFIINCIMDSKNMFEIVAMQDDDNSVIDVAYSDVIGGQDKVSATSSVSLTWDSSNINQQPVFADVDNFDYSLSNSSPCIDIGCTEYEYNSTNILTISPDEYAGDNPDLGWIENYTNSINTDAEEMSVLKRASNFPNPFNPTTTISFALPEKSNVNLTVFNIKGQKVQTLVNEPFEAGNHKVVWNGKDATGKSVSTGMYFYRISTDKKSISKKMLLLK